ncbi:hypothetical protein [Amycolatopsis sp. MtRt-6]|uniref:hypothetical protein n=1 Tax=Amycolatopsis sp. MtRt-6 TaxID=2792782 RepID=UPI001A905042|nr:hypothetical protein [Amycolatopsis sp. MtRt-6]
MSDLFRTERAAEIRQLLAEQTALLDDLLEGQRELGRRLGSSRAERDGLAAGLDGLRRTIDRGFAELDSRMEQVTQLARRLADKKAQASSPASKSINSPSCQLPSEPRS